MTLLSNLIWPLIACVALIMIHGYFGTFVLRRGIIFIDIALAQWAALGYLLGHGLHVESPVVLFGFGFGGTLVASAILASIHHLFTDTSHHEAVIGIMYIAGTALSIAGVSLWEMDPHHITDMISGYLVFIRPSEAMVSVLIYAIIGIVTPYSYRRFRNARLWDALFYALFGLTVTLSVKMVGVLLVFSVLIIPLVTVSLYTKRHALYWSWGLGIMGALFGIVAAIMWNLPVSIGIIMGYLGLFCMGVGYRLCRRQPGVAATGGGG
jgi:zinc/manganese transport system permease protein